MVNDNNPHGSPSYIPHVPSTLLNEHDDGLLAGFESITDFHYIAAWYYNSNIIQQFQPSMFTTMFLNVIM